MCLNAGVHVPLGHKCDCTPLRHECTCDIPNLYVAFPWVVTLRFSPVLQPPPPVFQPLRLPTSHRELGNMWQGAWMCGACLCGVRTSWTTWIRAGRSCNGFHARCHPTCSCSYLRCLPRYSRAESVCFPVWFDVTLFLWMLGHLTLGCCFLYVSGFAGWLFRCVASQWHSSGRNA